MAGGSLAYAGVKDGNTATINDKVTYGQSPPQVVSPAIAAKSDQPAKKGTLSTEYTTESGWTLGGSVEVAAGMANLEFSAKFTGEYEWSTQQTGKDTVTVNATPSKVAWIVASHRQMSITANYTFTADGTTYHVSNVSITQPVRAHNSDGDQLTATTYRAVEADYKKVFPADERRPVRWGPRMASRPG